MIAHKKACRLAKSQIYLSADDAIQQIIQMAQQMRKTNYYHHQVTRKMSTAQNQSDADNNQQQGVQCVLDNQYYITYFGVIDPKQLVSNLLINDGFPNRQHRRAILNKKMNHVGIGIHEHSTQHFVVVIVLANHIKQVEKGHNLSEVPQCQCNTF